MKTFAIITLGCKVNQYESQQIRCFLQQLDLDFVDNPAEADIVIVAIGNHPNPLISNTTPDLPVNKWGNITADETGKTGKKGVFAGGDIVTGAATVIQAMGAGRIAAKNIHEYIMSDESKN